MHPACALLLDYDVASIRVLRQRIIQPRRIAVPPRHVVEDPMQGPAAIRGLPIQLGLGELKVLNGRAERDRLQSG